MDVKIEQKWKEVLAPEFERPYFKELADFVKSEYKTKKIYPPPAHIFEAFNRTPFDDVRVVILGQDPYHGAGQAHGLCFSVGHGVRTPPSLVNIYKEIKADTGEDAPNDGNLEHWAEQGVLLLNATLTVEAGKPGSHQHQGWEEFTDAVIHALAEQKEHIVFMLWGAYAQKKGAFIDREKHLVLEAPHPSPFSADRGFFGCKHFSQANAYLFAHGSDPIEWAGSA
jgi:uracil-DNA glycosylase